MLQTLRRTVFAAGFYAITLLVAVAILPLLFTPRRWHVEGLRLWATLVLGWLRLVCGIRVRITGAEHLPPAGAAIIAAKHQSAFDTIIWLRELPDPVYVLKRELLSIPLYGWHIRHAGMIAIDRAAGGAAMRDLLRGTRAILAAGRQIVIFPEGTRVAPGERAPLQPGIAAMAAAAGLPVIPVATDSGLLWPARGFPSAPGVVTVAVLPALPAGLPRAVLLDQLATAIHAGSERLLPGGAVDGHVD